MPDRAASSMARLSQQRQVQIRAKSIRFRPRCTRKMNAFADKAIDLSPGGTGTSARMAQLYGKGRLEVGETYRHESIIGTIFEGRVESAANVGEFSGIAPSVGGWARVIGHNTVFVDDRDPLAHGFQIT